MSGGEGAERVRTTVSGARSAGFDSRTYDGFVHAKCCRTLALSAEASYAGMFEHLAVNGFRRDNLWR